MARTAIHPGEILVDELQALGISGAELARQIGVPANRINLITAGKRNISADTALRLGKWFGMSASFWMNLQKNYELMLAKQNLGAVIDAIPTREKGQVLA
jgi:addiction module HigA family antidote